MYFEVRSESAPCISKFEVNVHHVFGNSGRNYIMYFEVRGERTPCIPKFGAVVHPVLLSSE